MFGLPTKDFLGVLLIFEIIFSLGPIINIGMREQSGRRWALVQTVIVFFTTGYVFSLKWDFLPFALIILGLLDVVYLWVLWELLSEKHWKL